MKLFQRFRCIRRYTITGSEIKIRIVASESLFPDIGINTLDQRIMEYFKVNARDYLTEKDRLNLTRCF